MLVSVVELVGEEVREAPEDDYVLLEQAEQLLSAGLAAKNRGDAAVAVQLFERPPPGHAPLFAVEWAQIRRMPKLLLGLEVTKGQDEDEALPAAILDGKVLGAGVKRVHVEEDGVARLEVRVARRVPPEHLVRGPVHLPLVKLPPRALAAE